MLRQQSVLVNSRHCTNRFTIPGLANELERDPDHPGVLYLQIQRRKPFAPEKVRVNESELKLFLKYFPDEVLSIFLNNGEPAISTRMPNGRPTKLILWRGFDYLPRKKVWLDGGKRGPKPTTHGLVIEALNYDPLDITPENRILVAAKERRRKSSYAASYILDVRAKLIRQGKNPGKVFLARWRETQAKRREAKRQQPKSLKPLKPQKPLKPGKPQKPYNHAKRGR